MFVKQLSIFLENETGRLEDVLALLSKQQINIIALSLADTTEYGMLRLIVSNPEQARAALKEAGFSAMLTDVICLRVSHASGSLYQIIHNVLNSVGIEYMYAFSTGDEALNVIKFANPQEAAMLIKEKNIKVWRSIDIENL